MLNFCLICESVSSQSNLLGVKNLHEQIQCEMCVDVENTTSLFTHEMLL